MLRKLALRPQRLTVDFIGDHASIRPSTQKELDSWAATKEAVKTGAPSSINTEKVKNAVRGVE